MNRATLVRFAVLIGLAASARAQNALEIIALRHRTAEQVLPSLQPPLEPGGTLSGQGTQLFVRTSRTNLTELRRALEAIDRQARRLQISVRYDQENDLASRGVDASGRISNRGSNVDVRAQDGPSQGSERGDQRGRTRQRARRPPPPG